MAGIGSTLMLKSAQSQIHPAAGAEYYTEATATGVHTGIAYILPVHHITAIEIIAPIDKFAYVQVTIDSPSEIVSESANWETWNGVDGISLAITGFRVVSTWAFSSITARVSVRTRP